ncbi:hypothetical protein SAMN04487959_10192 [Modicisalibacter xianhensis]|uniref:Uncharacterized protein n=1 Tax=Modicisalibacter xianhensis TaxID=442341 RepID=A0A1I2XVN8_9GAMM|nr:hypothetical protein SAMN04487959_10192 [Halomonas xianhensis]
MKTLLVCYNLKMHDDYAVFYETLESYDHCWAMDQHCLIKTNNRAETVRNRLIPCIGRNDSVMICCFNTDWSGIDYEAETWLRSTNITKKI